MVIKNGQIVIYEVDKEYLKYLSRFDSNVRQKFNRRYTGILISSNNQDYCVPLTSAIKRRNSKLTVNIKDGNKTISQLTINNMIPVKENNLKVVDLLVDKDKDYINKEIRYLRNPSVMKLLTKKAENALKISESPNHVDYAFFKEICVNYKLLEEKCEMYGKVNC